MNALIHAAVQAALVPINLRLADVKERIQMLEEDVRVYVPDKVRNLSAQILLFFCGDQPVPRDRLDRTRKNFQEMEDGKFFGFDETFNQRQGYTMRCLTAQEWVIKFDRLIENRDGVVHFSDWNSLYGVVVRV